MIVKQWEAKPTRDKRRLAGQEAEKQMAFYLRRRYAEVEEVLVYNDLRVERAGDVAQVDHLLLHRHGMIVIESKSVSGRVRVNAEREFVRVWSRGSEGMRSPILQARRQGELLRQVLVDHKHQLRNKKLLGLVQGGFKRCPIDVLVAISDGGRIEGSRRGVPELFKAEQVVDEADKIIERHRRGARLLTEIDGEWGLFSFERDEVERVAEFLLSQHTAGEEERAAPAARVCKVATAEATAFECRGCASSNLEVRYGRSYYFKCLDCDANTPIKNTCDACAATTRTRKEKRQFFSECQACGTSVLFFTTPT